MRYALCVINPKRILKLELIFIYRLTLVGAKAEYRPARFLALFFAGG